MLLKQGNLKLGSKVLIFNLPRLITCTPSDFCREHCYCLKAERQYSEVKKSNLRNYESSLKKDFVDKISDELKHFKKSYVRIHSSGDFYSNEYIQKWIKIISNFPEIYFLAYSKRKDLEQSLKLLANLNNISMYESIDKSRKQEMGWMSYSLIIDKDEKISKEGFTCPGTNYGCKKCNYYCWHNKQNSVIFHLH